MCSVVMQGKSSSQSAATTRKCKDCSSRGKRLLFSGGHLHLLGIFKHLQRWWEFSQRLLDAPIPQRNNHCLSKAQLQAILQNVLKTYVGKYSYCAISSQGTMKSPEKKGSFLQGVGRVQELHPRFSPVGPLATVLLFFCSKCEAVPAQYHS